MILLQQSRDLKQTRARTHTQLMHVYKEYKF